MMMIVIGTRAAATRGARLWQGSIAFLKAMLVGAGLRQGGWAVKRGKQAIAAGVFAPGLLRARDVKVSKSIGAALISAFAVVHGYAHGVEISTGHSSASIVGFMLATSILHFRGMRRRVLVRRASTRAIRGVGAATPIHRRRAAFGALRRV